MSQYKSAIRPQQSPDTHDSSKYHSQSRQLQELFPHWSNDGQFFLSTFPHSSHHFSFLIDLQSLLTEVGGDVQIAATRISDGTSAFLSTFFYFQFNTGLAEQWGSVSRKKDKKPPSSALPAPKDPFSSRGDSRGARGGRGGRGGLGRGGAVRGRGGPPRGGAINGRSPRAGSPHPVHTDGVPSPLPDSKDGTGVGGDLTTKKPIPEVSTHHSGMTPVAPGWTDPSSSHLDVPTPTSVSVSSWGATSTTSSWAGDTDLNGSSVSLNVNVPSTKVPSKSPATSKLSWAQIARCVPRIRYEFFAVTEIFSDVDLKRNRHLLPLLSLPLFLLLTLQLHLVHPSSLPPSSTWEQSL